MTKLTPEEDFRLTPPAKVAADIAEGARLAIWQPLAKQLGWIFDPALGGYINESHRNYMGRTGYAGYFVADDAEEACFQSGFETLEEALAALQ